MGSKFGDVYDEEVWRVYGYFAYRLRSRADAEDLTQVTFERALKAWDRFDPERAEISTWLLAIARNALTDHHRRSRHRTGPSLSDGTVADRDLPSEEGPEERLGVSPELAAALAKLSRRERGVLALRFGADLRGPEIAELLDMSLANVQQVMSRALRRLRRMLQADASIPEGPGAGEPERRDDEQQKP